MVVSKTVGEGQELVGLDTNVTTGRIVDAAVTTAKLADAAITIAKLVSPKLLYIGLYDYAEYDRFVYDF